MHADPAAYIHLHGHLVVPLPDASKGDRTGAFKDPVARQLYRELRFAWSCPQRLAWKHYATPMKTPLFSVISKVLPLSSADFSYGPGYGSLFY